MAWAKTHTGSYELGFVLLALTALLAVVVLELMRRGGHPSQIETAVAPDT